VYVIVGHLVVLQDLHLSSFGPFHRYPAFAGEPTGLRVFFGCATVL